jgi:iron complex outermembrane receptor protein
LVKVVLCIFAAIPCFAQAAQPSAWLREIAVLESPGSGSLQKRHTEAARIRREVQEWMDLRVIRNVAVPPADGPLESEDQLQAEVAAIRRVLEDLVRKDPVQPFYLGTTVVQVTTSGPALSPVFHSMDQAEIRNRAALTVKDAIEYLPGVSVDHKAPRNQAGISITGFDTRQVPLYQDSIPIYVPFDGYVDLTRYLTSDVAEIQVAKGYTSPLLGPNLMGGVINLAPDCRGCWQSCGSARISPSAPRPRTV